MKRIPTALACSLALCLTAGSAAAASNAELTRQSQELQTAVRALEARLARIEAGSSANARLLALLQEVEQLRGELSRLRGESEVHGHRIEQLDRRQTELYTDVDQRLTALQKPLTVETPAVVDPVETTSPVPAASSDETTAYEAAFALFRAGNYPDAISRFRDYLRAWPNSLLASNAQYWIGHSFYALKDHKTALAQHQKLLITYPASAKVPDALLNMATNQLQLGDTAAARKTLEKLIADHPDSNAASLARKRLAVL